MNEDFGGLFDEPAWADSPEFEEVFLMWRAKANLAFLVVPQAASPEPRVVFCNLSDGGAMFLSGLAHPDASMTFAEARAALDFLEEAWQREKGPAPTNP